MNSALFLWIPRLLVSLSSASYPIAAIFFPSFLSPSLQMYTGRPSFDAHCRLKRNCTTSFPFYPLVWMWKFSTIRWINTDWNEEEIGSLTKQFSFFFFLLWSLFPSFSPSNHSTFLEINLNISIIHPFQEWDRRKILAKREDVMMDKCRSRDGEEESFWKNKYNNGRSICPTTRVNKRNGTWEKG